ncbi:MAG: Blue-light-activated protein, partial [Gemmataceae bacterium]|nr:Blue-light-activated protein [Gemmataceae bacterium]
MPVLTREVPAPDILEDITDAMPHMVWVADAGGATTHHNRRILDYAGLPAGTTLGAGWEQVLHPDDLPPTRAAWSHSVETGEPFETEYRLRGRNGTYRWFLARATAQLDRRGRAARWVGTCTDIDDQKGAQARFRAIIEQSFDAVDLIDASGTLFYSSPSSVRLLGLSVEDQLGRDGFAFLHPDDVPAVRVVFARLVGAPGSSADSVHRTRHADGHYLWVEFRATNLLHDPAVRAVVVNFRDVTDRVQAEAEARDARAAAERGWTRLRAVVESMTDGLVTADPEGNLLDWNPAALRIHGFDSVAGALRHMAAFVDTFSLARPDGSPVPHADWPMARVLRGETVSDQTLLLRRSDTGTERVVVFSGAPVRGSAGEIELGVVTLRDITRRKRAEAEVRRTADLLHAVANETTDAVFVKDRDGKYLLFNPAAGRLVGMSPEEVIGRDDTAVFDPDGARALMASDRQVMASGAAETREEELTAAGVTRTYLATKAPYRDAHGTVVGVVGI